MTRHATWLAGALVVLSAAWVAPIVAQEPQPTPASGAQTPQPASAPAAAGVAATALTHHVITIDGQELRYTAEAGYLQLRNDAGQLQASMFYIAFVQEGQPPGRRPITFTFNGGPGAASVWLNLGAMGPKRLVLPEGGLVLPRKIRLVKNEFTWLPFTDMVFIDPIGSGYSHVAPGVSARRFYGVQGDVESVGRFIRLYVSQCGRWTSPKFIAGESYGTTRAAALAKRLARLYGMNLDGLILLSSALDFQTFVYGKANDLAYVLSVPTYAAVAWYHHKLPPELQQDLEKTLAQVEQWTIDEYGPALARGDELPQSQREKIAHSLHRFTGLSEEFIKLNDLRISNAEFAKELLRDEGRIVGILDGRVTGFPLHPASSSVTYDPSLIAGPFAAAIQEYLRTHLDFRTDREYVYLSFNANETWNWGSAARGYVNVMDDLQAAMTENPDLSVLAGMGYFDLATNYLGQTYTLDHLRLASELQKHITMVRFLSGHQIYMQESSLKKLTAVAREFITACSSSPSSSPAASRARVLSLMAPTR